MDLATQPKGIPDGPRYTAEQIQAALDAMSPAERGHVIAAAKHFAPRSGMGWQDLAQEAYARALGTRTCAVGVTMPSFLCGIVRSIASEGPRAREKLARGHGFEVVPRGTYGDAGLPAPEDGGPSPEDGALAKVFHTELIARALACIEGDEQLQLLVEGQFEGLRGKDLEELVGVDTKGLAAAKRRLTRKLEATFPEGMML